MNILFLAGDVYGLSSFIIKELKTQGHRVFFIKDTVLPNDNGFHTNTIFRKIKNSFYNQYEIGNRYWQKFFYSNPDFLNREYDICICINGYSLHPHFFKTLIKHNPKIKFILYLWDSLNFFDFKRNLNFFDKVYSFDFKDSQTHTSINFLPLYWIEPSTKEQDNSPNYCMTTVGSNHYGRLHIAEAIAKQLKEHNFSYKFHIVDSCNAKFDKYTFRRLLYAFTTNNKAILREIKIHLGWSSSPLIKHKPISIKETINLINHSNCILDTDNEKQAGPTPRLIWALALGKKIVTTNKYIVEMPFYNKNYIYIIDRKNPCVSIDFLLSNVTIQYNSCYFEKLRIDNWVNKLLNYD